MAKRKDMKQVVRRISEDLMIECLAVKQDKPGIPQSDIENIAKSILLMQADFVNRLNHVDKRQVKRFFAQFNDDLTTTTNEIIDSIFHLAWPAALDMVKSICRFLLYKFMGWKANVTIELPAKYIIALAPHTSNWDFIMGLLYSRAERMKCQFMMKKEWFFWPLGPLFRKWGGIPVERSKKQSLTDQMAQQAQQSETFGLCITPEGTRKAVTEWKRGFYYIALKAELPILLFGLDYSTRSIVCTKTIIPNGDIEAQMTEIKQYFAQFKGKRPELFAV